MAHSAYATANAALTAYVIWLTTRRRATFFGEAYETPAACETLFEFKAFNPTLGVDEPINNPVPTYFSPSSKWYAWEVRTFHLPIIRAKRWLANVR